MAFVVGLFLSFSQGCTPPVEPKIIEKDTKPEKAVAPPPLPPPPKK